MQLNFGVGQLLVVPPGSNPTPLQFGVLQDVSLDIKYTKKKLYGAYEFPVDSARAQAEIGGKIKSAAISGALFNQVLTGSAITTGQTAGSVNEAGTIPGTPYQVTVTQSATWVADNGVIDLTAGATLTRVASAPTTGQYSVAAGVYTFAAADTTHSVLISYTYTLVGGKTVSLTNQLMGAGTSYVMRLFNTFRSKALGYTLYAVTIDSLSLPLKNEDYTINDLEYDAYADTLNRVIDVYTAE